MLFDEGLHKLRIILDFIPGFSVNMKPDIFTHYGSMLLPSTCFFNAMPHTIKMEIWILEMCEETSQSAAPDLMQPTMDSSNGMSYLQNPIQHEHLIVIVKTAFLSDVSICLKLQKVDKGDGIRQCDSVSISWQWKRPNEISTFNHIRGVMWLHVMNFNSSPIMQSPW